MTIFRLTAWLGFMLIGMYGCQTGVENQDLPPGKVQLVAKTAEDSTLEKGIDAIAIVGANNQVIQNAILIEWHPLPDDDLVAYEIYRKMGDSTGTFNKIAEVRKEFERLDTVFVDTEVSVSRYYFYYVRARDELGQQGPPSEKVGYMLLPWPDLESPINNDVFQGQFVWNFDENFVPARFVFRLERQIGQSTYVNIFTKLITLIADYSPHQEWNLAKLETYGLQTPLPTGTYRWRIDVMGSGDYQGAESNWAIFRVQ